MFVHHDTEYEHPYGDIVYGNGNLSNLIREFSVESIVGKNVLSLGYISPNHWTALKRLRYFNSSHLDQLMRASTYECPYTSRTYQSLIPIALFDDDVERYFHDPIWEDNKPWYYEMATDKSWNLRGHDPYSVYRDWETDRKSTRLNSSHSAKSRMPSSA